MTWGELFDRAGMVRTDEAAISAALAQHRAAGDGGEADEDV